MVSLEHANVFYGNAQALSDVTLAVGSGEVIALLGRNGAGKSTTLKAMAGWMPCRTGTLTVGGTVIVDASPEDVNLAGVALVPEDRQVFPTLTVEENLRIAAVAHPAGRWTEADVVRLFPRLDERRKAMGSALSGGEQQMLAIGRALLCQPTTLLLDEPTEGLAPVVVSALADAIVEIARTGMAIVLVEQNAKVPKRIASRFYVFDGGRIAWQGTRDELDRDDARVTQLLSI